jgi:TRAP-type C4-dicarboxylate transport system substrate-binding protein
LRLNEQAKTVGSTRCMSLTPLVMSLASFNALTGEQKSAFEDAAEISDVYSEALQRAPSSVSSRPSPTPGVRLTGWRARVS